MSVRHHLAKTEELVPTPGVDINASALPTTKGNTFSPVWILSCILFFLANFLSHFEHANGFPPVCVFSFMCL